VKRKSVAAAGLALLLGQAVLILVAAIDARGVQKIEFDIAGLQRGSWTHEVAHTRDKAYYAKLTRYIGIVVLILTAATGTAVVAALATSTATWAKVFIGISSVLAAVAAALNQRGPFGEMVKLHATAASSYNALNRKVRDLDRQLKIGQIDPNDADRQLTKLEASYDDLEDKSPDVRDYKGAQSWVEGQEAKHPDPSTVPLSQHGSSRRFDNPS
jgi:hypothetical protein